MLLQLLWTMKTTFTFKFFLSMSINVIYQIHTIIEGCILMYLTNNILEKTCIINVFRGLDCLN